MIVGKNTNLGKQGFATRMTQIQNNNQMIHNDNQVINPMLHSNVLSKSEMHEKSFQMLQDRLNKGLISLDEFNKKCKDLNKR